MALKKPGQRGYKPRYNAKPKGQPNADMLTYDNALPCKNPNCKSHGKPHPNCKCYGSSKSMPQRRLAMAEGGQVCNHFCDACLPHESDCEYFAEGGQAGMDFDTMPEDGSPEAQPATGMDFDTMPEDQHDFDTMPEDAPKEHSYGQQALAGAEGAASGVLGPLATYAELHPWLKHGLAAAAGGPLTAALMDLYNPTKEEIVQRQEDYPVTHTLAEMGGMGLSMFTGVGEAGLTAKLGQVASKATKLGKLGSRLMGGLVDGALLSGGDEMSKSMLGQGDPEAPVASALAHMGAGGLLGLFGGALAHGGSSVLGKLAETKAGNKLQSLLGGVGAGFAKDPAISLSAKELAEGGFHEPAYVLGDKIVTQGIPKIVKQIAESAGGYAGGSLGGVTGTTKGVMTGYELGKKVLGPAIEKTIGRPITTAGTKYGFPTVLKMLKAGDFTGLWDALDHADDVARGAQKINSGIEALFKSGAIEAQNAAHFMNTREKLKDHVENGELQQQIQNQSDAYQAGEQDQNFAEGGKVKPPSPGIDRKALDGTSGLATHFPDQNILMQMAKGRITHYLNGVRPQKNPAKLPFDRAFDDHERNRAYDKAIDLAVNPMGIMHDIKRGSLNHETLGHFMNLYPELHSHLSKKMTERIVKSQLGEEKLPYAVRQSMSLFLGAPLDSTMTPASIQAIQAVFAKNRPQQQAQNQMKPQGGGSPDKLKKIASNLQTSDQSRADRQQKV